MIAIDANIINKYIQGFESMLVPMGVTIKFNSLYRERLPQDDWLIASLMNGQADGKFIIGMSDSTFMLVSQIFQVPNLNDLEMKRSFLKEIGNMVVGHTIAKYQQIGINANLIEINCYDNTQTAPEFLKRAQCVAVGLTINEIHPLMIYFILGDDYRKYQLMKNLSYVKDNLSV